jgi:hypothetical protein
LPFLSFTSTASIIRTKTSRSAAFPESPAAAATADKNDYCDNYNAKTKIIPAIISAKHK